MAITVTYNGHDITTDSFDISIGRGRSRDLDEFQPASGSVSLRNFDRNFDPPWFTTPNHLLMESGDFLLLENGDRILLAQGSAASGSYGTIEIGGTLVIQDGAVTVFSGHVEDINYRYSTNGTMEATFYVGDVLTSLASTRFQTEWQTTDQQRTGSRISAVLARSDVNLSAAAGTINTGDMMLQDDLVAASTNVLQYLQLIARTEHGKLYSDRSGALQFRSRYTFPSTTAAADFDDVGTNFRFGDVEVRFGSELRAWNAVVQRVGGEARTAAAAATPPAALGERGTSRSGLLLRGDSQAESLAEFLADKLSQPEAVVSSITVNLHELSTADRAVITALDIDQSVTLTWTPGGSGGSVTQDLVIEGVRYRANSTQFAQFELQLSAFPETNYFTLDTDSLDGGVPLGF